MKVLYFHQHFSTPDGAGGTRSYEFARALVARGHRVTMVCGRSDFARTKQDIPVSAGAGRRYLVDEFEVIELPLAYSNYDSLLKRSWIFLRFSLRSIILALREDYDLLFATSTPLTAAIPGIAMKLFRRKPFVFEVRDLWPELPKAMGVVKNPLLLGAMGLLEWFAYRASDACIGLSPGIVEGIKRRSRHGHPVIMIPNGCDLHLFRPGERRGLRLAGVGPGEVVAVFTGAHGLANGLNAVLDAASVLQKRARVDIKFVFIGDGKLKPALRERAQREKLENCLFFDPMPKRKLTDVLACADLGLMILANVPAFYYGTSPNKFFDYLASGLPVLNNYPGWLSELITTHQCGVAVSPDNPEAFADALERLADNPELREKMRKNARALAEADFSRDQLVERFVSWLEASNKRGQRSGRWASHQVALIRTDRQ
jgi:glycosyltransferase involved in cell wall biosynthesis